MTRRHQSAHARRLLGRVLLAASCAAVLLLQHGCGATAGGTAAGGSSAGTVTAGTAGVKPGAAVEVRFQPTRDLLTARSERGDTTYSQISAAFGRVQQVRGDTLWIAASELRSSETQLKFPLNGAPVVMVIPGETVVVRALRSQATNALVVVGIGAAVVAGILYIMPLVLSNGL